MNKLGFLLFNFTARTAGIDIYINADVGLLNNNVHFNCYADLNIMMLTK
ncbi:hypothetical protein [Sodalis sp. (in: enterobacteria)]